MLRRPRGRITEWQRYLVAVGCAVIALPMIFFREGPAAELNLRLLLLAGVMFSSWFGGWGPGVLTTMVASLAIAYSNSPYGGFRFIGFDHLVRLVEFIIVALLITFLNDRRRQAQQRAERAQAEAETANRAKDEFLATVSHELRTPLTSVLGWASLMRSEQDNKALRERALDAIERNARKQHELIEDLIEVSRINAGQLRLSTGPIDLAEVIDAAIEVVRPAIDAKGIRIRTVRPEVATTVIGDDRRLQQVLWNLLSNAVKFTPEGGLIQITLEYANCYARILVKDSGHGIDKDLLPHIFERFRQGEQSRNRYGGLGLGLAIARELVELHGGTIEVKNAELAGAEFTIQLPRANINRELRLVKAKSATAAAVV